MSRPALCLAIVVFVAASGLATQTAAANSDHLDNRDWMLSHLGAEGLRKCRVFKRILRQTQELQQTGHGAITGPERERLQQALDRAKAMPPAPLTPAQCGVAL
jgi:hypothetical protein